MDFMSFSNFFCERIFLKFYAFYLLFSFWVLKWI